MTVEVRPLGVQCNLQCQYCYQHPQRDAANITATYDLEKIKAKVLQEGRRFSLFGGEALLIPERDLEELWAKTRCRRWFGVAPGFGSYRLSHRGRGGVLGRVPAKSWCSVGGSSRCHAGCLPCQNNGSSIERTTGESVHFGVLRRGNDASRVVVSWRPINRSCSARPTVLRPTRIFRPPPDG